MHYVLSTLSCFSTLYCTLMVTMDLLACVYMLADRGSTILKRTSTQAGLILYGDVCKSCLRELMIVYYLRTLYLHDNQGLSCLPMELEQFKRLLNYGG
jgi:hypothetical protein